LRTLLVLGAAALVAACTQTPTDIPPCVLGQAGCDADDGGASNDGGPADAQPDETTDGGAES